MRIYLAGGQAGWREQLEGHDLLVSFAEPRQCDLIDAGWDVPGWVLDSGAFTAWTKGRPIDLDAYSAFVDSKAGQIDGAIALDIIPGAPGRLPTDREVEAATSQSFANLAVLRERHGGGLIWPVYHEGEPMDVLDTLVRWGWDRIALGATASRGRPELADWLLPIFDRHPGQAFHGLAMTQARTVANMPFVSVDSTSWLNFARYGVAANAYLLKGRSPQFRQAVGPHMRALGIAAIEDFIRCPPGLPPSADGQLRLYLGDPA